MIEWLNRLGLGQLKLPPLKPGEHASPEDGLCAMEMVAFIERLPHSDRPACTCPVLATVTQWVNDTLPDGQRERRLLPLLPRLVGTVAPEFERLRARALLEATFELATRIEELRLRRPLMLNLEHYRDPLQHAAAGGFWRNMKPPAVAIAESLLEALDQTTPQAVVNATLEALHRMWASPPPVLHWAKVALYPPPMLAAAIVDGPPPEIAVEVQVIGEPVWSKWSLRLLEHLLAIGPKGRGWSYRDATVTQRVQALAALA